LILKGKMSFFNNKLTDSGYYLSKAYCYLWKYGLKIITIVNNDDVFM